MAERTAYHLKISGMCCVRCEQRIRKALQNMKGIHNINVSYKRATAEFESDNAVTYDSIVKAIEDEGYTVAYTAIGAVLGTVGYFIGGGSGVTLPLTLQGIIKIIAGAMLLFSLGTLPLMLGLGSLVAALCGKSKRTTSPLGFASWAATSRQSR